MSEKIVGGIEEKQSKDGETNGKAWKRFVFKISGKTFSSFDTEMDKFKIGDVVEAEYTTKDNYNNLTSMKLDEGRTPVSTQAPVPSTANPAQQISQNYYEKEKAKEASIVAQVILKELSNMVCAGKIEPGAIKSNAPILVEVYKETHKKLLE